MIKKCSIIIGLGCMLSNAPSMLDCMGNLASALCGTNTQQSKPAPVEQQPAPIINVRFSSLEGLLPGISVNIPADTQSEVAYDMLSAPFPNEPGIVPRFVFNRNMLNPDNTMRLLNGHNNPIVRMVKDRRLADLAEVLAGLEYTFGTQYVRYNDQLFGFCITPCRESRSVGENITVENIHELETYMVSFEHLDDKFMPHEVKNIIEMLEIAGMMNSYHGSEIFRMTEAEVDAKIQELQASDLFSIELKDGQRLFNIYFWRDIKILGCSQLTNPRRFLYLLTVVLPQIYGEAE